MLLALFFFFTPPMGATLTCDVIDNHGHSGISYVARDETPEAFLPGRVPKLQPHLASHVSTRESRGGARSEGWRERRGEKRVIEERRGRGGRGSGERRRELDGGQGGSAHQGGLVGVPTCDVVHDDGGSRVADVAGNETTEALLARRVPQLQPDLCVGWQKL